MDVSISMEGLDLTKTILAGLGVRALHAAHDSLLGGANDVAGTAEALAPRLSGMTASQIEVVDHSTDEFVSISVETGSRGDMQIAPNDPYYYPAALEFGTATQRPQPFMRPAAEQHADGIIADVSSAIAGEVSQ